MSRFSKTILRRNKWSLRLYVIDLTVSFKILNDMQVCILLDLENKI